jgi:E3 ubiquitin-protein ligase SHPRH
LEPNHQAFKRNGIEHRRLKGRKNMESYLGAFKNEPTVRVLVLPLKSGAQGLNLVEARHVFLLEPVLHMGVYFQAIGRVHRIGQRHETNIHLYTIRDTIEGGLYDIMQAKMSKARLEHEEDAGSSAGNGDAVPAADRSATSLNFPLVQGRTKQSITGQVGLEELRQVFGIGAS